MRRLPKHCAATIRVEYPDGCRHQWKLEPGQGAARDALTFAARLTGIVCEIEDGAERDGLHAAPKKEHAK